MKLWERLVIILVMVLAFKVLGYAFAGMAVEADARAECVALYEQGTEAQIESCVRWFVGD